MAKPTPPPKPQTTSEKKATARRDTLAHNRQEVNTYYFHEWARGDTFSRQKLTIDAGTFNPWRDRFVAQQRVGFQQKRITKKQRAENIGLGLRSTQEPISLDDDDALACSVTSHRRLSRCHFEDVVGLQKGDPLVLYFRKDAETLDGLFRKTDVRRIAASQRKDRVGGETIKLAGVDYLVVKAQILSAQWHQEAAAGFTSLSKFRKQFDEKEGFSLAFPSSSDSLPMKWWQVVKWADSVLLFAPPRNGVRAYDRLFKDRTNVQWIQ